MKVSKTLFDEVSKLSLKEWEDVRTTIDYLFYLEREKTHLNPSEIKDKLKFCPIPIQIKE